MADVFLSYRNTPVRRAYIERLRLCLDAYGISAWWDYGLEAGSKYEEQILNELAVAALVSPIWCERSIQSEWVCREARFGLDHRKLLPARFQNVSPPKEFEPIQCQDLVGWNGSPESYFVTAFASAICARIGRPLSPAADKIRGLIHLPELPQLSAEDDGQTVSNVAHLQIERATQMSAGGVNFLLFWNTERLGELRMGNSSAFDLPPGSGQLQVGMHHAIKRTLHLTAPLNLQLLSGEVTRVRIKVGRNLYGFPPIKFWTNNEATPETRGWVTDISDASGSVHS